MTVKSIKLKLPVKVNYPAYEQLAHDSFGNYISQNQLITYSSVSPLLSAISYDSTTSSGTFNAQQISVFKNTFLNDSEKIISVSNKLTDSLRYLQCNSYLLCEYRIYPTQVFSDTNNSWVNFLTDYAINEIKTVFINAANKKYQTWWDVNTDPMYANYNGQIYGLQYYSLYNGYNCYVGYYKYFVFVIPDNNTYITSSISNSNSYKSFNFAYVYVINKSIDTITALQIDYENSKIAYNNDNIVILLGTSNGFLYIYRIYIKQASTINSGTNQLSYQQQFNSGTNIGLNINTNDYGASNSSFNNNSGETNSSPVNVISYSSPFCPFVITNNRTAVLRDYRYNMQRTYFTSTRGQYANSWICWIYTAFVIPNINPLNRYSEQYKAQKGNIILNFSSSAFRKLDNAAINVWVGGDITGSMYFGASQFNHTASLVNNSINYSIFTTSSQLTNFDVNIVYETIQTACPIWISCTYFQYGVGFYINKGDVILNGNPIYQNYYNFSANSMYYAIAGFLINGTNEILNKYLANAYDTISNMFTFSNGMNDVCCYISIGYNDSKNSYAQIIVLTKNNLLIEQNAAGGRIGGGNGTSIITAKNFPYYNTQITTETLQYNNGLNVNSSGNDCLQSIGIANDVFNASFPEYNHFSNIVSGEFIIDGVNRNLLFTTIQNQIWSYSCDKPYNANTNYLKMVKTLPDPIKNLALYNKKLFCIDIYENAYIIDVENTSTSVSSGEIIIINNIQSDLITAISNDIELLKSRNLL